MAYYGGGNSNNAHDYKLGIVTHLMAMGFEQEDCIEAARATNNKGVQEAFDYLSQQKNVNGNSSSSSSNNNQNSHTNHGYGGYNNSNTNNNNNYGSNSYGGYNNNHHSNNTPKAHYQRKASYNEAHFSQLKELGLGDNDTERREACRKHPDDLDGAMEYLYEQQKQKEQKKRWGGNSNSNNNNNYHNNHSYGNNNNNHNNYGYYNTTAHKMDQIKQKYPELSDEKIRDLLDRHNGNVANTLKFIELKVQQQRQREQQLQMQRRRAQEEKEEDTEEQIAQLFMSLLSLAVVEDAGFVTAADENKLEVVKRLTRVEPKGQTALRDAVVVGIAHMLKVKSLLMKLGALKHKFVHVVLTDGEDTASKGSHDELKGFFRRLGTELGDLCKTYFIGVGLNWKEKQGLEQIASLGGDSVELFNCQDVEISNVFNRISIGLGIRRQIVAMEHQGMVLAAKRDQLALQITENKFLVLFTLDMSGSMSGGRWRKVVQAVATFMHGLKEHDIVGCVLFNEKPVLITDK